MKTILLICTTLCAIGINACHNNINNNVTNAPIESLNEKAKITNDSIIQHDTLWINGLDWEI